MLPMRRGRRAAALLALLGLAAPGGAALAVTLHQSAHHDAHHKDGRPAAAVDPSAVWHGHSHPATTPGHDHPLLLAGTHVSLWPAAMHFFSHAPVAWQYSKAAAVVEPQSAHLGPPGLAGVGPPTRHDQLAILRI